MSQYRRNSSTTVRPRQPSPLASDAVGNPGVESVNELLSPPAQSQPTEPKTQPIWIMSDGPPRPPRRSRRRPQTAPHPSPSSSDTRNDTHGLLPIILQFPDSPKHPSELDELRPSSLPPTTIPTSNTGFLNRVPKRIHFDDDAASTSSPMLPRRPSVPTLKSYIRPSTAATLNPSEQLSRSTLLRREPSLMSMDASRPVAEVRSRAKSSIAFSEVVPARRKDHRSADLNPDDRRPTISPLSFTRPRTPSEMSHSPPVTASTLNDESTSSLTVYESLQEETQTRQGDEPRVIKKPLWDMTKVHSNSIDKKTLAEPQPSHLITFQSHGSTLPLGFSGSPSKPEVRPDNEITGERDEKTQTGMTGGKATPPRTGGTMRRVWRSIIGRK
ncbi:hypothetical protein PILCRDRAFT_465 [Piloderma croceum F 1598]|uniref:Uncharacterized protein n=1 Tax=Piloderma croceum (strain F 1598) TaxID=765440 RepID=A0A0C3C0S4_PILCF|nr:hypothetical protein PILCRDRAFT_465 [Piloderma croceum F 1598]